MVRKPGSVVKDLQRVLRQLKYDGPRVWWYDWPQPVIGVLLNRMAAAKHYDMDEAQQELTRLRSEYESKRRNKANTRTR